MLAWFFAVLSTIPSYLHKVFYDRGVDIGVGVVTSVMVGFIGLLFWKGKLWLDLRADKVKQKQKHEMEDAREQNKLQGVLRERHERLSQEREGFVASATSATGCQELAQVWTNFLDWLQKNELEHLPKNQPMFVTYRRFSEGIQGGTASNVANYKNQIVRLIKETELPSLSQK